MYKLCHNIETSLYRAYQHIAWLLWQSQC